MMERYPAHEVDDLILPPKQQESFFDDLPPTTDSCWSQWGINNINATSDDSLFRNKPSVYDRPDFQFNQLSGADDRMDDIFVYSRNFWNFNIYTYILLGLMHVGKSIKKDTCKKNSLLKEDHKQQQQPPLPVSGYCNDNQQHIPPFCFSPESHSSFMPEDGNATSMMLDFVCVSSDAKGPQSSGYYETGRLTFTPSVGWVNNNGLSEMERKVLPSAKQGSGMGTIHKETSMEESVLNQLGTVMTQLNDKTRLCIRDSLYRLARSTKGLRPTRGQNAGFSLNNPPPLASGNRMARSGTAAGVAESETNAFDRAVANLMFNKADDFISSMSSKSKDVPAGVPASYTYSMIRNMQHHSQPQILKTQFQDPFFSMVDQRQNNQKEAGLPDFCLRNFIQSEPAGSDIRWTARAD